MSGREMNKKKTHTHIWGTQKLFAYRRSRVKTEMRVDRLAKPIKSDTFLKFFFIRLHTHKISLICLKRQFQSDATAIKTYILFSLYF